MTQNTNIALAQTGALAKQFNIGGEPQELIATLKATVFKGNPTNEQFTALLIVASQYGLNPFTREIYAFPDKNTDIVPVVGVDGWARILNGNPQFDGMEFEQDDESCTCKIYRKDRNHPISVTEFFNECRRNTQPWQSHPKRMLRHKAMIQAARLAFGFAGIFDEDEAERVRDAQNGVHPGQSDPFGGERGNPARDEIIRAAEAVAAKGNLEAMREYVRNLTKEQRAIAGTDEIARWGDLTKHFAANTIDSDAGIPEDEFAKLCGAVSTGATDFETAAQNPNLSQAQRDTLESL